MLHHHIYRIGIVLIFLGFLGCELFIKESPKEKKLSFDLDATIPSNEIPSIRLDIPFKPQVPPGDWKNTANCSPACFVMLDAYERKIKPSNDIIKEFNDWASKIHNIPINNYNGSGYKFTHLRDFAKEKGHLNSQLKKGNLPVLIDLLKSDIPVIVSVRRKMREDLKTRHAMVVVGIDSANVYVNDPGRRLGKNNAYPLKQFLKVWRSGDNHYFIIKQKEKS